MRTLYETVNPAAATSSAVLVDSDGRLAVRETQDVQAILDANRRDANDYQPGAAARRPGGFRHIARIPVVVISQLRAAGIIEGFTVVDEQRFMQFLNDPDVRKLRCDNGRRV